MRIIPVFDLMGGIVVRGVAGRREEYQAVKSILVDQPVPAELAQAIVERFGFDTAYIADLNAIAGSEPDWPSILAIANCGLHPMIDLGIGDSAAIQQIKDRIGHPADIIVGLESLPNPDSLSGMLQAVSASQAVFSLDLKAGVPFNSARAWQRLTPRRIAELAFEAGFQRMIILDIASVGIGGGPSTLALCREIREAYPHIELITGGGICHQDDISKCADAGCDAVLVASAIHDGKLPATVE